MTASSSFSDLRDAGAAGGGAVRHFGRFQLLRLLGRSELSMLWLVMDSRVDQELLLALPRRALPQREAMARWQETARRAVRTGHPGLAHAVEVGEHDHWPYVVYERGQSVTLAERISSSGMPDRELARLLPSALQGLAFAHDGGLVHGDIQPWMLQLSEAAGCRLLGLGVALCSASAVDLERDPALRREAVDRDLLAFGLCMHHALAGRPPLGETDLSQAIERLPPWGHESVRLPWRETLQIDEALRAIVDRATARQPRQRFANARTLEQAVSGWLRGHAQAGGTLSLLLDRVRQGGLLPAMPDAAARLEQLLAMEASGRTDQMAELLLQDMALCFELLRQVNLAGVRGALGQDNGAILTVRRAIALLGLDGVRRAARMLRPWPGTLAAAHVPVLAQAFDRVRLCAQAARWLRPPGFDGEVVSIVTMLQSLGQLVLQYHLPAQMTQVRRLTLPTRSAHAEEGDEPGMTERAASYAVLGFDAEAVGLALGQAWGLDEAALLLMRRQPLDIALHASERDADQLRSTASCAIELIALQELPWRQQVLGVRRLEQRYARMLQVNEEDLMQVLHGEPPRPRELPSGLGAWVDHELATHRPPSAAAAPWPAHAGGDGAAGLSQGIGPGAGQGADPGHGGRSS